MRDLPEVETIRRDLDREFIAKKVKTAEVLIAKSLGAAAGKARFLEATDGAKLTTVARRGRLLVITTDRDDSLAIDLGGGGQLRKHSPKDPLHKRTAWVLSFTQGGQLRMVDLDADASTRVVPTAEVDAELGPLGIDAVDEPMSWTSFGQQLLLNRGKLKSVLTDDSIIVGIGSMYADEILFEAGLRHDRELATLNAQELRRLYRAIVETMHDAMKYRGTTLEDDSYVDLFGEPGSFQDHLQVFGKDGELSPRSRKPIVKAKFAGTWTYYCEQSQV